MSTLVNEIRLIGNVGTEPRFKETTNGSTRAALRLATNEKIRQKDGSYLEETTWHNLVFWGKEAITVRDYVKVGAKICIIGKITYPRFNNEKGEEVNITEIVVDRFEFLSAKKAEA